MGAPVGLSPAFLSEIGARIGLTGTYPSDMDAPVCFAGASVCEDGALASLTVAFLSGTGTRVSLTGTSDSEGDASVGSTVASSGETGAPVGYDNAFLSEVGARVRLTHASRPMEHAPNSPANAALFEEIRSPASTPGTFGAEHLAVSRRPSPRRSRAAQRRRKSGRTSAGRY
jgi:hypothetical protein